MSRKVKDKKPIGKLKKTVLTVLAVILIVLLIVAAVVGIKFRSHIKAAIIWLTTSDEDIQKNIDKAKEQQTEVLTSVGFNASKELDDALSSGLITAEEHTQILLGNLTLEQVLQKTPETDEPPEEDVSQEETKQDEPAKPDETENTEPDSASGQVKEHEPTVPEKEDGKSSGQKEETVKPQPTAPPAAETPKQEKPTESAPSAEQNTGTSDVDKRIAELITKMYMLKSEYTGAVDGVVASMKAEYVKLPAEQRNTSAKQSIAARYVGKINAMEAQCDAQVNAIVTELRKLLKDNGRDTALADAIVSTYASEKENTKAYYLSTYGD